MILTRYFCPKICPRFDIFDIIQDIFPAEFEIPWEERGCSESDGGQMQTALGPFKDWNIKKCKEIKKIKSLKKMQK